MAATTITPLNDAPLGITGIWRSSKACYNGSWFVDVADDGESLTIAERSSTCCGCVPNCIKKKHRMQKESGSLLGINYTYKGTYCCKTVCLEIVSSTKMKHLTTDGLMIMTRDIVWEDSAH